MVCSMVPEFRLEAVPGKGIWNFDGDAIPATGRLGKVHYLISILRDRQRVH